MYYGWNIVAIGILFQGMTFGITIFVFTFWAEAWMNEFNVDRTQVTFTFMVFNLAIGVASATLGRLLDKKSIRVLIICGAASIACGFILISLATAMWQITLVYMTFIGIGCVLAGPLAAQTLAAKWFNARRGLAIGWGSVGTSLGGLVMPPIAIYLLLNMGWRQTHQILAVATLIVIAPVVWKFIGNTPEDKGIEPEPGNRFEVSGASLQNAVHWTTGEVLRQRNFWIPIIAFLPAVAAFSTVQANLRLYTIDLGIDPQTTAFLMSLIAGTMIGGKLFFGSLADRVDQRILYWIAASILGLCMLLLIGQPSQFLLTIVCAMLGFAAGGFLPLLGAIVAGRFGPAAYGQVFGMMSPFLTLSAFAPTLAGWIRDTTGSYDLIFKLILVVLIPAMCSMFFMQRQESVPTTETATNTAD